MAYNLDSFHQILAKDQYHPSLECKDQIKKLKEQTLILIRLRDFAENPPTRSQQDLDSLITDATHCAEDTIESHIIGQVFSPEQAGQLDLTGVFNEFDSIREAMSNLTGDTLSNNLAPSPDPDSLEGSDPSLNETIVGFDADLDKLVDRLTNGEEALRTIPMVGMGGMGKTTLARHIYNHSSIVDHFDIRAWVAISQQFDVRRTLLALLHTLNALTHEMHEQDDFKLGEFIHKTLKYRRYLIVVDDIWVNVAWDKLRMFFPNDNNESRIVFTTRERDVANYVCFQGDSAHEMHLFTEDDSWNLLVKNVFGQVSCPIMELEEPGRKIANYCGGLPLAIMAMAGLLSESEKTLVFWESIGSDLRSTETRLFSACSEILSLSYNQLPYYLKPCFLYVGAFAEDNQIQASKIVKLWVAEGIIKPNGDNTLEDVAEVYLNALIDRNLLSVCEQEASGKVRTFQMHQLFRDLCQRKAVEEKFLWFKNADDINIHVDERLVRRVSAHSSFQPRNNTEQRLHVPTEQRLHVRSFLCFGHASCRLAHLFFDSERLRVLDVLQIEFVEFPIAIEQLINLRYLGLSCRSQLPSTIFKFRNLQALIIRLPSVTGVVCLPSEVWEMTHLMHIDLNGTCIEYRPKNAHHVIQMNLETLSNVEACGIVELLRRTPNLRKLGIYYNSPINSEIDFACLVKLEKLKCSSIWPSTHEFLSYLIFPICLKKLTLSLCVIPCGFMESVGNLPNLEQLKLKNCEFLGLQLEFEGEESKWELVEDSFSQLISLTMENLNLVYWIAEGTQFPLLQHLFIRGCYLLMEIPVCIGETVELIEMDESSPCAVNSARQMEAEQNDSGNPLKVLVHPPL